MLSWSSMKSSHFDFPDIVCVKYLRPCLVSLLVGRWHHRSSRVDGKYMFTLERQRDVKCSAYPYKKRNKSWRCLPKGSQVMHQELWSLLEESMAPIIECWLPSIAMYVYLILWNIHGVRKREVVAKHCGSITQPAGRRLRVMFSKFECNFFSTANLQRGQSEKSLVPELVYCNSPKRTEWRRVGPTADV